MTAVAITGIICLAVCWLFGYMVEDEQRRREHEERMAELDIKKKELEAKGDNDEL